MGYCRSKNDHLAQHNIHELVKGRATSAQRALLSGGYAKAETLERNIEGLKASLKVE